MTNEELDALEAKLAVVPHMPSLEPTLKALAFDRRQRRVNARNACDPLTWDLRLIRVGFDRIWQQIDARLGAPLPARGPARPWKRVNVSRR